MDGIQLALQRLKDGQFILQYPLPILFSQIEADGRIDAIDGRSGRSVSGPGHV